jgi:hypothetical protein
LTANLTHSLGVLSNGALQPRLEPRQLYQVKHDYELHGDDFRARPAEVFRMEPQHYVKMSRALQEFWFSLIRGEMARVATEDQMKAAWRYLTDSHRAFTNGQGPDILRDYITGERMDQPLPGISTLICGGNVLAGREDGDELVIETIDPTQPLPFGITHNSHPWLVQWATVSTKDKLANGTYKVTRFAVAKMMGCESPVPVIANREVRIKLAMLKKLSIGAPVPSPYNL